MVVVAAQIGELIERARIAAGLSQRALAEAAGISQPTLSRIIVGNRQAKMPEIITIARATGHTVAQLSGLSTVADRVQYVARATNGCDMDHMRQTLLHYADLNDYLDDYVIPAAHHGEAATPTVGATEARDAAASFRKQHHLGVQPLGDLVAVIEQAIGIDVAILDVGPDEHGLTMRDPQRNAVFIGVARSRNPMRQRSTLAHELAHVLFRDWENPPERCSDRTPAEIRADNFARHLLVPIEALHGILANRKPTPATLSEVVQQFLVSPQIAAIALHQGGYIDEPTKHQWMALTAPQLATRFGWIDQYHVLQSDSDQRRPPQRLLARGITAYERSLLPAQAIATLRGTTVDTAEADLREAGIFRIHREIPWANPADLPDPDVDIEALDRALNADDDDAGRSR